MIPQDMLSIAEAALEKAYCVYSNFSVSACLRTADGSLISGCNVENAAYGLTICAEANAVGTLINNGNTVITEAVILSNGDKPCSPCGACRQLMMEFAAPEVKIHMCCTDGNTKTMTLEELLPFAFSAKNLDK